MAPVPPACGPSPKLPEPGAGCPAHPAAPCVLPTAAGFAIRGGSMRDPAHTKSVGLLLGGALCWSLAGVLFKHVEWSGLAAAGGRGLIAALFLLAVSWRSLRFTWGMTL